MPSNNKPQQAASGRSAAQGNTGIMGGMSRSANYQQGAEQDLRRQMQEQQRQMYARQQQLAGQQSLGGTGTPQMGRIGPAPSSSRPGAGPGNTGIMGGQGFAASASGPQVPGMHNPNNPSDMTRVAQNPTMQGGGSMSTQGQPTPFSYTPQPSRLNEIYPGGKGSFDPSNYMDENFRNMMEGYTNYFAVPFANAQLAERTQAMNEAFGGFDRAEQQRLNTSQMGLAERASGREDTALEFGMGTNRRDFSEGQRQFNQNLGLQRDQFGLSQELGRAQVQQGDFANQTQRMIAENQNAIAQEQNRIAQFEAQTGRTDVEGRQRLEQFANETARMGMQNQFSLGQEANANNLLGIQNQFALGQGQLGFSREELANNDAFRRAALAQEDALTRQRLQNEMIQARYAAFGRAQAPNARALASFY